MPRKRRSINQAREEKSYQIFRDKLPKMWVIHDYSPDYGIDCVIELFDFVDKSCDVAETLGEVFFVQLKSSDHAEYSTLKVSQRGNVEKGITTCETSKYSEIEVVKFQLETSQLLTVQAMGSAVPVLLVFVDLKSGRIFYVCLNDYIDKIIVPEDPQFMFKESKIICIPVNNEITEKDYHLVGLRAFGKRAKMYGAFSKFYYQYQEIKRAMGLAVVNFELSGSNVLEMLRVFTLSALSLSIWENHEFWKPIKWSHDELLDVLKNIENGIDDSELSCFLQYCEGNVWRKLVNISSMYEELVREWFLPTYLGQLCSQIPDLDKD